MKHLWNYLTIVFVLLLHATVLLGAVQSNRLLDLDTAGIVDDFLDLHYTQTTTLTHNIVPKINVEELTGLAVLFVPCVIGGLSVAEEGVSWCKNNNKKGDWLSAVGFFVPLIINAVQVWLGRDIIQHSNPPAKIPTITHFSLGKETIENGDDQYHCKLSYHTDNQCVRRTFPYRDKNLKLSNSYIVGNIVDSPTPCCSNSITGDISSLIESKRNRIYTTVDTQTAISDDKKIIAQALLYKPLWQYPFINPQYQVAISIHSGSKSCFARKYLCGQKNIQNKLKSFAIVGTTAALMFLGNRSKK